MSNTNDTLSLQDRLAALRRPFHPDAITFKPGSIRKDGTAALGLAYADLRAYQDRLDDVMGAGWDVEYKPWGDGRIICSITLDFSFVEVDSPIQYASVTRSSTGETTTDSDRGEIGGMVAEAQAFKRACAMLGLGRYLYGLPQVWAEWDGQRRRFTDAGMAVLKRSVVEHYNHSTGAHVELPGGWAQQPSGGPFRVLTTPDEPVVAAYSTQPPPYDADDLFEPPAGKAPKHAVPEAFYSEAPASPVVQLVEKVRALNAQGGRDASEAQVRKVLSTLSWVCGKGSDGSRALELLLGGEGIKLNMSAASHLIDVLNKTSWDAATKTASPNPNYQEEAANAVQGLYLASA